MSARLRGWVGAAALLIPVAAGAANGWTLSVASGETVMDVISPVTFLVTNSATSANRVNEVILKFAQPPYDVESAVAPRGWSISAVDRRDRHVTFVAVGACPNGLAPGQSALFTVSLVGAPAAADATDALVVTGNSKTQARDTCAGATFSAPTGAMSWKRVGLDPLLTVSPRTLDLGGTVTVTLNVTNESTATQSAIAPTAPTVAGGASFSLVSGPSPATLSLATGNSGTFTWTYAATGRGPATFTTSAQNGTVSTPSAASLPLDVGIFPALTTLTPTAMTPGQTVTVQLGVSNETADPFQQVLPKPLVFNVLAGNATATLVSGPSPASEASLPAGGSAGFTWRYSVSGAVGSTFQFVAQATAQRSGVGVTSDAIGSAVGTLVTDTLTANPANLLSGSTNRTIGYTVVNGGALPIQQVTLIRPDTGFFKVAGNPFAADTSGWNHSTAGRGYLWTAPNAAADIAPGASKTFTLSFTSVGPVTANTTFGHQMSLVQTDGSTVRVYARVTLFIASAVPDVFTFTALSGAATNTLVWSNPADHDGVLVLRAAGASPNTAPVAGTTYAAGATLGNATVVYSDSLSFASSVQDTGLSNGTRYFYKVYNHDLFFNYGSGNVPSTTGLFSIPTSRTSPNPAWCYSVGLPTLQQPVAVAGVATFTSSNSGAVSANITSPSNPSVDGTEVFRPTALQGPVQNRFPVVPLQGRSGDYILTGDQSGFTYAVNAQNGAIVWRGNSGVAIGNAVQGQPGVQLYAFANPAFQAANPGRDLVFFATRNTSATNNRVVALSSVDGSVVWSYAPGNMDIVSGGMLVDYVNNHLVVVSRSNGGTSPSVRILDTLAGGPVASFSLGDIDLGVNEDFPSKQAYVVTNAGVVYGLDLTGLKQVWSFNTGALSAYPFPVGNGFIASLKSGAVQRYAVDPSTHAVTAQWATSPAVPGATGVRIDYTGQTAFVGDSAGRIHQLDLATGADQKQISVSSTQLGAPTLDATAYRLVVGTLDGQLCSFQLPLP